MNDRHSRFPGKVEINDLLDDAISNAIARRYPGMNPDDALSALSEEETADVAGGLLLNKVMIYGRIKPDIGIEGISKIGSIPNITNQALF